MLIEDNQSSSLLAKRSKPALGAHCVNKIGYRKLQNGKIVKTVAEQYIRPDIACGVKGCPLCEQSNANLILKL